jgi:hypothetical protein
MNEKLLEKLLKGKFIVTVLGILVVLILAMNDQLDSTQAGLSLVAIITAFLHFDGKAQ